jgi:DNA-binding NarL/FixJ family response regulator
MKKLVVSPVSVTRGIRAGRHRGPTLPMASAHNGRARSDARVTVGVASRVSRSALGASAPISIVLADDQLLVRGGIRCLVEMEKDLKIIGEVADGHKVVGLVERLTPRMLIVALAMPGLNGLEITRLVRQQSPATAVIVLSMFSADQYVIQALRNGAWGYVVKQAKPAELVRAIRRVAAGSRYLSAPMSTHPIATWLQRANSPTLDAYETLTHREREILRLVADGNSNAGIASALSISRRTAESHRARVMHKLRLKNTADLIRYVLSRALQGPLS